MTAVVLLERGDSIVDLFNLEQDTAGEAEPTEHEAFLKQVYDRYNLAPETLQLVQEAAQDPLFENKLIASFAPFVQSNDAVKLALLLQMLSGVEKLNRDRSHTRADLNVLLVGDPSTAKSQFLRYVAAFSERSIYTSGKSASAAGLTAAVALDPDSGEWGIECGAMLRASGACCCIDELDKISQQDLSALHEAMEQQQVSISKAGVSATMEAKTAVLAAMNPVLGRYNLMQSLRQNVALGGAILSRFDLVFVMADTPSEPVDRAVAGRILGVLMGRPAQMSVPFSLEFL